MATVYKILGQSCPAANTDTTVYTVPSATYAVISSIVICNITTTARTYRIAVRPNGATIGNDDYIAYDETIPANSSFTWAIGVSLDASDVITVRASATDAVAFNVFGAEIDV